MTKNFSPARLATAVVLAVVLTAASVGVGWGLFQAGIGSKSYYYGYAHDAPFWQRGLPFAVVKSSRPPCASNNPRGGVCDYDPSAIPVRISIPGTAATLLFWFIASLVLLNWIRPGSKK